MEYSFISRSENPQEPDIPLQVHQRYSIKAIYEAFGGVDHAEILCGGDFIVFPAAIVCCVVVGHPASLSHFTSPSDFEWKPRHFDYAPKEQFGLPAVIWETRDPADRTRQIRWHHLFAKTPADSDYFYAGPVSLSRHGTHGTQVSASFSLEIDLPRPAWLALGGSLLPSQPFASLPVSEEQRKTIRFHGAALDLLHIMPPQSRTAAARLDRLEQSRGIHIPASVREWYSLMGCMEVIMRAIQWIHTPADITDYDEDLVRRYAATPPYLSMLPVMYENQGVWHLAVVLDDQNDDPPVYLGYQEDETFEWQLHARHFSDFVYAWAWEYALENRDYIIDVSEHITGADMATIRETFQPQATTFEGVGPLKCDRHERYTDGTQRVTVLVRSEDKDVVWFSAESADGLEALLRRPWSFAGRLGNELGFDIEMQKMYLCGLRLPKLK